MKERKKYRDELELRTVTRTESNNQAKRAVESESEKSRTDGGFELAGVYSRNARADHDAGQSACERATIRIYRIQQ